MNGLKCAHILIMFAWLFLSVPLIAAPPAMPQTTTKSLNIRISIASKATVQTSSHSQRPQVSVRSNTPHQIKQGHNSAGKSLQVIEF